MQHLVGTGIVGAVDVLVHVTDFQNFVLANSKTDAGKSPVLVKAASGARVGRIQVGENFIPDHKAEFR